MALRKFSELLFRINNPGVTTNEGRETEQVEEYSIFEGATYKYNDLKAPGNASITTGYGDINHRAVVAHLKNNGVPDDHAKAIGDHLKAEREDFTDSDKKGFEVKSKHGNFVVHSTSSPDTGLSKFHVSDAMKN